MNASDTLPLDGIAGEPSDGDLLDGRPIRLTRAPANPKAAALVAAVVDLMIPHSGQSRAIGKAKLATLRRDVGMILGGLLRSAADERVVSAPRGHQGSLWKNAPPIGRKAFWSRTDALIAAGLVGHREGVAGPELFAWTGRPTRLWATPRLLRLASEQGVELDDIDRHWTLPPEAAKKPVKALKPSSLVVLPGQPEAVVDALRRQVAALNDHVRTAEVSGCLFPVFVRRFGAGDPRLGGRLYAIGTETFQTCKRVERQAIRLNGSRVVEADVRASQLTVFLHLTGQPVPKRRDPYALDGFPREVVKAFITQAMGNGKLLRRWGRTTAPDVAAVPIAMVHVAVLRAYPSLSDLTVILPTDMRATPPPKGVHWAAGQFIVGREAAAVMHAVETLKRRGVIALPIFDGLVVRDCDGEAAAEALRAGFVAEIGVEPHVTVKG